MEEIINYNIVFGPFLNKQTPLCQPVKTNSALINLFLFIQTNRQGI